MLKNISIKARLFIILIIIWAISISILFLLNSSVLYSFAVKLFNLPVRSGISERIMVLNFDNLVQYLQSPYVHHFSNLISIDDQGRKHFADVKNIMILNDLISMLTTIVLVKAYRYFYKHRLYWILYTNIKYVYMVCTAFFVFCLIDFNDFFVFLHNILFRNKDWIFDVKSNPIIKVFPTEYFIFCGLFIYMILSLSLLVTYWWSKHNFKNRQNKTS